MFRDIALVFGSLPSPFTTEGNYEERLRDNLIRRRVERRVRRHLRIAELQERVLREDARDERVLCKIEEILDNEESSTTKEKR